MIEVGFTGTRRGMSPAQLDSVSLLLRQLASIDDLTCRHGDCVGADSEFHDLSRRVAKCIVVHPPVDEQHRAYCFAKPFNMQGRHVDLVQLGQLTHLARNRAIVDKSTVVIAAPLEPEHQPRGGTWYTFDYARKRRRPTALVLRVEDGARVEYSGGWPKRSES